MTQQTMTTDAARRFLAAISQSWDSSDPWEATAARGLSEYDSDALEAMCDATGESYGVAEAELLAAIREHVAA